MSTKLEFAIQIDTSRRGQRVLKAKAPRGSISPMLSSGKIPRVSRLMALAIRLERQLASGELRNYAQIARLGHVTRARVTQIMTLLRLAPDIQTALLNLPAIERGRDPITERQLRAIANTPDWRLQRELFKNLVTQ